MSLSFDVCTHVRPGLTRCQDKTAPLVKMLLNAFCSIQLCFWTQDMHSVLPVWSNKPHGWRSTGKKLPVWWILLRINSLNLSSSYWISTWITCGIYSYYFQTGSTWNEEIILVLHFFVIFFINLIYYFSHLIFYLLIFWFNLYCNICRFHLTF